MSEDDKVESPRMQWYAIQAMSGKENIAMTHLKQRIPESKLEDHFGDILVPTEEVVEMRSGQKRKSTRKFYPGYVLIRMQMNDETWHIVKNVPQVLNFVGHISDKEADTILSRVEEGAAKPRPKVLFEPGEVVRVIDGPFADFNGVVEEVNYEKSKLRVEVLIFGRSTPVELDFNQVEKS